MASVRRGSYDVVSVWRKRETRRAVSGDAEGLYPRRLSIRRLARTMSRGSGTQMHGVGTGSACG